MSDMSLVRDGQLNRFFELIRSFPEERRVALETMYSNPNLGEQLINAPASRKPEYHNAFPGGYLDHVLRVYDLVCKQVAIYANNEGWINFTKDEMTFAALHHDLGKLGDLKQPIYLPETDSYWIKKGFLFKQNPDVYPMTYTDRTFFLLQHFGVKMTQNEMVAIRTTDGMYDEATHPYLMGKDRWSMRSNLGYLMHWADHMATIIEKDTVKRPELEGRDDI